MWHFSECCLSPMLLPDLGLYFISAEEGVSWWVSGVLFVAATWYPSPRSRLVGVGWALHRRHQQDLPASPAPGPAVTDTRSEVCPSRTHLSLHTGSGPAGVRPAALLWGCVQVPGFWQGTGLAFEAVSLEQNLHHTSSAAVIEALATAL